jgi:hypothetical protein
VKTKKWFCSLIAVIFAVSTFSLLANAQGNSQEHGKGQGKNEQGEEYGKGKSKKEHKRYYSDRNREELRAWYRHHESDLPPGLAKKDRLPPGLERQLRVNGTLPPGLQREAHECPHDIEKYLPAPPPDCEHILLGGQIVLRNKKTQMVLDIIKLF